MNGFWVWLQEEFVPTMESNFAHAPGKPDQYPSLHNVDHVLYVLGDVKIRQIRVKKGRKRFLKTVMNRIYFEPI